MESTKRKISVRNICPISLADWAEMTQKGLDAITQEDWPELAIT
jgi:hypothetical protein